MWCLPVWPWWAPLWCPAELPHRPRWHQAQWRSPPSWLRAGHWPERPESLTWGWTGWPAPPLTASQCSSAGATGATGPPAGQRMQLIRMAWGSRKYMSKLFKDHNTKIQNTEMETSITLKLTDIYYHPIVNAICQRFSNNTAWSFMIKWQMGPTLHVHVNISVTCMQDSFWFAFHFCQKKLDLKKYIFSHDLKFAHIQ